MAEFERWICRSVDLADSGDGIRFEVKLGTVTESAFAVRYEGRVHAYLNRCAHVGFELDWNPGKFFDSEGLLLICSAHGALYASDTGKCAGGPCFGRALVPVPVKESNGEVYVKENQDG